jgi:2-polyprenyl-3-methyl-5-hydroxy-6-metoxy-1,4-benzoquinol methylase
MNDYGKRCRMIDSLATEASVAYHYPDPADLLTQSMISAVSDARQWEAEEGVVLETLRREFVRLEPPRSVLDVGAGTGRLTWYLSDLLTAADLLEPDADRARSAEALAQAHARSLHVAVFRSESDLPCRDYDLVLLSHIIQHVAPEQADHLLSFCAGRTRPGGLLYLATVLAENGSPKYRISELNGHNVYGERIVDEETFRQELAHPRDDHLPVRSFSNAELEAALRGVNLEPLAILPFHEVRDPLTESAHPIFRDVAVIARRMADDRD